MFCSQEDTLGTAIRILASSHVHTLYVVDSAGKLAGVLTLCDVSSCCCTYVDVKRGKGCCVRMRVHVRVRVTI